MTEGIVLLILGLVALFVPPVTRLGVSTLLGWIFVAVGIAGTISTIAGRHLPGFWWVLFSAIITFAAGCFVIRWPGGGTISFSLLLITFFVIDGALTILFSLDHRRQLSRRWGWLFANGIVDFALAVLIVWLRPGLTIWIFSLMVGFDLIFGGWSLIVMAVAGRASLGTVNPA
jgi:uncharacterized membrane protein HdeD (DUF308 family)